MTRLRAFIQDCLYDPDGSPVFEGQEAVAFAVVMAFAWWWMVG